MTQAFLEMISYPFMQRALVSGAILALLLASLGIFVSLRKMAFFGDGIAHASLAGIAIAVLAGVSPLPVALVWALLVAALVYWLERRTSLPSDTLIGIIFTASMSLGVILMSFTHGYQPELVTFLFGSILAIRISDMILIAVVASAVLVWLAYSLQTLTYMSLSEESAIVAGLKVRIQTAVLYAALAVAVVLGVKILGIILVPALLILPAATSRMLTGTFRNYLSLSLVAAELAIILGLVLSYFLNLPSGATIVLVGAAIFFVAAAFRKR